MITTLEWRYWLLLIEFANGNIFKTAMSKEEIEEGAELLLDFEKLRKVAACGEALVPAIAPGCGKRGMFSSSDMQTKRR